MPGSGSLDLWLARRDEVAGSDTFICDVLSRYTGLPPAAHTITRGRHGKPQLAAMPQAPAFNASDSGDWLALAVGGATALGVDLECCDPGRDVLRLARRCFSATEIADMEALGSPRALGRFYDYWTLKEARVKALGGSLGRELQNIAFSLARRDANGVAIVELLQPAGDRAWFCLLEPLPGYRLALCRVGDTDPAPRLSLLRWPAGEAVAGDRFRLLAASAACSGGGPQ